jgi:hypothetical protein
VPQEVRRASAKKSGFRQFRLSATEWYGALKLILEPIFEPDFQLSLMDTAITDSTPRGKPNRTGDRGEQDANY